MGFREPAPDHRKGKDNLPVMVLPEGTLLNDTYKVSYLTTGGMSYAYKGIKEGKTYFIKEVEANDSRKVISITQEKFMLERLNHAGIVKVRDFFEQEGFYYLVLDFIEGQSLDKLISPHQDIFLQEHVINGWVSQLYDILQYLHEQQPPIIYRDLKPLNIIKDHEGRIHLVDFGIARNLKEDREMDTDLLGSALTASPEHFGSKQTDARSDIYSLGATLHYLLANGRGSGKEHFSFIPVRTINPKLSEHIEKIILKAVKIDPEDRFQSIREMRMVHLKPDEGAAQPAALVKPEYDREIASQGLTPTQDRAGSIEKETSHLAPPLNMQYAVIISAVLILLAGGIFLIKMITSTKGAGSSHGSISPPQVTQIVVTVTASPASPIISGQSIALTIPSDSPTLSGTPHYPIATLTLETPSPTPPLMNEPASLPFTRIETPPSQVPPSTFLPEITPDGISKTMIPQPGFTIFPTSNPGIKLIDYRDPAGIFNISYPDIYEVIQDDHLVFRNKKFNERTVEIAIFPHKSGRSFQDFLNKHRKRISMNPDLKGEKADYNSKSQHISDGIIFDYFTKTLSGKGQAFHKQDIIFDCQDTKKFAVINISAPANEFEDFAGQDLGYFLRSFTFLQ